MKNQKSDERKARDFLEYCGENLENYGDYRSGLTQQEIKEYLEQYAKIIPKRVGCTFKKISLYKVFCKVAGVNTMPYIPKTQCCKKELTLMFRHDVKRFADKMFLGAPTYFD